jgi:hypothetical protein
MSAGSVTVMDPRSLGCDLLKLFDGAFLGVYFITPGIETSNFFHSTSISFFWSNTDSVFPSPRSAKLLLISWTSLVFSLGKNTDPLLRLSATGLGVAHGIIRFVPRLKVTTGAGMGTMFVLLGRSAQTVLLRLEVWDYYLLVPDCTSTDAMLLRPSGSPTGAKLPSLDIVVCFTSDIDVSSPTFSW